MSKYLIKGISKEDKVFSVEVYAENIAHAAMTSICDFIKEITSIEKVN